MVDKIKNGGVWVPVWAVGILITIIGWMFYITYAYGSDMSQLKTRASANEANIKTLQETKADIKLIERIESTLNRIESKFDQHTQK